MGAAPASSFRLIFAIVRLPSSHSNYAPVRSSGPLRPDKLRQLPLGEFEVIRRPRASVISGAGYRTSPCLTPASAVSQKSGGVAPAAHKLRSSDAYHFTAPPMATASKCTLLPAPTEVAVFRDEELKL